MAWAEATFIAIVIAIAEKKTLQRQMIRSSKNTGYRERRYKNRET
jgi:hypothetical protein